jgi:hypothetical protein
VWFIGNILFNTEITKIYCLVTVIVLHVKHLMFKHRYKCFYVFFLSSLVFTAQFTMYMIVLLCYTKLIKDKREDLSVFLLYYLV